MKKLFTIALCFSLLFAVEGCKVKGDSSDTKKDKTKETTAGKGKVEKVEGPKEVVPIIVQDALGYPAKKDDFNIESLNIEGDTLAIEVTYTGCAEHDWALYGNRYYRKSLPPQLNLFLFHDQYNDYCKKRQSTTLYYNIKDIRFPGKKKDYTIILYFNETDKTVSYRY